MMILWICRIKKKGGHMVSILQDWVMRLPLRYQGVLLTAMRGCDGAARQDTSKVLIRGVRWATLNPADIRELSYKGGFMSFDTEELLPAVRQFAKNCDEYPLHFVLHLMHAIEVVGYKHPDPRVRPLFYKAYVNIARSFHLQPESCEALEARMLEDRIATGNVGGIKIA